uniref:CACTA en-spm transposon protein n=1 Tax=Caenorhabditis tropicalis TaxID=1561998 RepID=A0A1I7TVJ1_9PELO
MVHSRSHLSRQFSQLHKHYFSNKDKFDLSIVPLIIKSNYWISTMDHWNGKKVSLFLFNILSIILLNYSIYANEMVIRVERQRK